ncbi:diaminohydroxyphosphoribosylaminopyrimidine deaminase [Nonlabens sp. Hel1_33_55]|uniref:bifunctional diaminohydroxyphosphoribosylaminopyrimidine deaminase/5-amino-6-(5-phosphoribosylamino)uracil reductase RibD n=1 Tax=Nonlabens sp. Hel1_33_55 TaxID=1336802 RepID=UPI000875CB37|nr:bifunctional diaminohydroxyphosphoribosylaminopyrimidine deaminase/5-amino-6-(5-phosphoribosylamino)uracil reductase RibD [Nonlabens sp. Hel1_33_55]SCY13705.1 diaminohydroxyphosphoribosylaminopyrimidine deaminase [Nonlabens sp. Hel1_33_55]
MTTHEIYIQRCLQLALNGLGTTYPNPLVGSVIVNDEGKILGEGFHLKSGKPHAEVNAIADAEKNGFSSEDFRKATIYVNLEPCSHHGKTPPCASLIIEKGFKNVVVGTLDPHEKVAGKGVDLLLNAGIKVTAGILEADCNELNKRFFTYHKKRRPFIILKWAETADGFIAPKQKDEKKPVWITNPYSRQLVHKMRAQEQSILIGAQTAMDDNPSLTVRDWHGDNPIRIILDAKNNLPENLKVFDNNAVVQILQRASSESDLIVEDLYNLGIQSVIVEGGAKTLQGFIDHDLWDEIHQFMGTEVYFKTGLTAPKLPSSAYLKSRQMMKNDVLKTFVNS